MAGRGNLTVLLRSQDPWVQGLRQSLPELWGAGLVSRPLSGPSAGSDAIEMVLKPTIFCVIRSERLAS